MTFLEAKKIVEERGYRIAKNIEGESFRERVAREELEEAKRVAKRAGYQIINEDVDDIVFTASIFIIIQIMISLTSITKNQTKQ